MKSVIDPRSMLLAGRSGSIVIYAPGVEHKEARVHERPTQPVEAKERIS